ncbi:2-succinyl-5-enolpyruvyl-6-hydroxy-3-cyclohexene-1-carboxylic-acid synthase [Acidithrix ferrooxidans]|uniref:2-succinyl-5-enolpyruvyl-6-hydroxy-3-cyclohexene-1-carboxylate synthase n=1 Tax=Acidithrix ferrooxidans TaxID=1280514 RepID=A0A0D8HIN2_9ACTN|nr:2-succinyl-5-enolpyruvyl-6-hydroxy-3-cyclohexene-1-carboxylic-acid synthase [Acidithrix ferrooxidans]KJF16921.1 2-succinyl-5-enolpyruvyl-6-hydroxy-3-cyclohexene-1-carboxylate synthase [Acidithrix ferrooxidans]
MTFEIDEAVGNQFVAMTIVDELYRNGVRYVAISPGSRSTPLALAFLAHHGISARVILDERSSSFFALGLAKASNAPVAILTTSGTASVELSPAITEAYYSGLPLIVLSSDRPLELYGTGSSQTINQTELYSGFVVGRILIDAGAKGAWSSIRSSISRAVLEAKGLFGPGGPFHLNVSFREPLISPQYEPNGQFQGRGNEEPWYEKIDLASHDKTYEFARTLCSVRRGLIVVGEDRQLEAIFAISELLGWPTLVDPRAGIVRRSRFAITHFDSILRQGTLTEALTPAVILYFGMPSASKVLSQFIARVSSNDNGPLTKVFRSGRRAWDPEGTASGFIVGNLERLVAQLSGQAIEEPSKHIEAFTNAFLDADGRIEKVIEGSLDLGVETRSIREVVRHLLPSDLLFVSASMPIRDLESFASNENSFPVILENRGTNGIDGIIATFSGSASHLSALCPDTIAVLILGDLSFLYDVSFLRELSRLDLAALIVVLDNNGGGIFSFLSQKDIVDEKSFETLFGTPHNSDLDRIARGFGIDVETSKDSSRIQSAIEEVRGSRKTSLLVIKSDRDENLAAHKKINEAIAKEFSID